MELSEAQRAELTALLIAEGMSVQVARRAQAILWKADGVAISRIVRDAGMSHPTLNLWCKRYMAEGVTGLTNRPPARKRSGVPSEVKALILDLTHTEPPAETGVTHWSSRAMARYLRDNCRLEVSHGFVSDLWRRNGLRPHIPSSLHDQPETA